MNQSIEIRNVKHRLSTDSWLEIPELIINPGHNILVRAEAESGLSTFLKLISGVIPPESGAIRIFGEDLNYCNESIYQLIKKKISYVYQHGVMISNLTIQENMLLTLNFHVNELSSSEKTNYINDFVKPFEISHLLLKRPVELTFMQRKLFGIIRSCLINPELLVLDEPFQNFDSEYTAKVESILEKHVTQGNRLIIGTTLKQSFHFVDRLIVFTDYLKQPTQ